MSDHIQLIEIKGFKSIADLQINDTTPFVAFAGPNGAGKSNLVDGLAFFGAVIKRGAKQALRDFGGFQQIHCFKHRGAKSRIASLELKIRLQGLNYHYQLQILHLDSTSPRLREQLSVDSINIIDRLDGRFLIRLGDESEKTPLPDVSPDMSALMFDSSLPLYKFLTNIQVFRFDPLAAKEPNASTADTTALDIHGRNVATIMSVLEKDANFREQILDWIELLVPGMEKVSTEKQRLDGNGNYF